MAKKTAKKAPKKPAKRAAKKKPVGRRRKSTAKTWTSVEVLADWIEQVNKGLGNGLTFEKAIFDQFERTMLDRIQARLDAKDDYNKDRSNVHKVAKSLGKICKELTEGSEVSLAVFEAVFAACQLHPSCPGGAGSGKWCN